MENIRELVRENLVLLRKAHKMTQLELAERIGYSDKAISRWETGEVTPDIETLDALAKLYGVPISVLFEKYNPEDGQKKLTGGMRMSRKVLVAAFAAIVIWCLGFLFFIYLYEMGVSRPWVAFIWIAPATFLVPVAFSFWWKNRIVTCVFFSLFVWSLIAALYFQLLDYNMYFLFILGVPIQAAAVISIFMRPKK